MQRGKPVRDIQRITIFWKRIGLRPYETFPSRLQAWILNSSLRTSERRQDPEFLAEKSIEKSNISHHRHKKSKKKKGKSDSTRSKKHRERSRSREERRKKKKMKRKERSKRK